MLKRFSFLFLMLIIFVTSLNACKKSIDYSKISSEKPDQELQTGDYNLDFIIMHNYVIDYISGEVMPFFFIKENGFDISGDNSTKTITIKCNCVNGTTIEDLNLFLSMALNGIATNAAEQDYRFTKPTIDKDGTFLDYGNIFKTYSLNIYATIDDNSVLMDKKFPAGSTITIDPRYIKE